MDPKARQRAYLELRPVVPEDDDWLHWWVKSYWGIHIPNVKVCANHDAPFTAFADAFFGRGDAFVCHGSRLFGGKCQRAGERVLLPDGRLAEWGQLAGTTFSIYAPDPSTGGAMSTSAHAEENGEREVVELHLDSGDVIARTPNHPIQSGVNAGRGTTVRVEDAGMREAGDFARGDYVLTRRSLPEPYGALHLAEEASLLGLMLGDGMTKYSRLAFTNDNPAIVAEAARVITSMGGTLKKTPNAKNDCDYTVRRGKKGELFDFFVQSAMLGKGAHDKRFPEWAWRLDNESMALLLNRLWATDGWIQVVEEGRYTRSRIEFSVVSERLRDDLALAMHRLGVPGYKAQKSCGYRVNGEHKVTGTTYTWRPYPCFVADFFAVLGPILGKESESAAIYLRATESRLSHSWRLRGAPEGYFWQKVRRIVECEPERTIAVYVPDGNLFLSPVLEHNTFLSAVLGMTRAVLLGAEVNILGGSEKQAKTMQRYMKNEHPKIRGMLWEFKRAPKGLLKGEPTATLIRLNNGGSVQALAASQKATRGEHGTDLYCDEVDEMEEDVLSSALGQTYEGQTGIAPLTFLTSTWQHPNGTMSWLFEHVEEKNAEGYDWRTYEWCYQETHERYGGHVTDRQIKKKKGEMTALDWANEVELNRPESGDLIFDKEVIDFLFDSALGRFEDRDVVGKEFVFHPPGDEEVVAFSHGADWAKQRDLTVITTLAELKGGGSTLGAIGFHQKEPWPQMLGKFNRRVEAYGGPASFDGTGMAGDMVEDNLMVEAEALEFSQRKVIHAMYSSFVNACESGEYIFPEIMYVKRKLSNLTRGQLYESTRTSKKNHTPDVVVSLALARRANLEGEFDLLLGRV